VIHGAVDADDQASLVNITRAIVQLGDPRGQEAFDLLKTRFKNDARVMGFILQSEKTFQAAAKAGQ
jgi:hypothetical protein